MINLTRCNTPIQQLPLEGVLEFVLIILTKKSNDTQCSTLGADLIPTFKDNKKTHKDS